MGVVVGVVEEGSLSDRQLLMTDTFKLLRPGLSKMPASVSLMVRLNEG